MRRVRARRVVWVSISCMVLAAVVQSGARAGELDQQQPNFGKTAFIGGATQQSQTFTAGKTGLLDRIDLGVHKDASCGPGANPLHVEIRSATNDLPDAITLATVDVPSETVPSSAQFFAVPFPAPASISAGSSYAIVLSMPASRRCHPTPTTTIRGGYIWGALGPYDLGRRARSDDSGATFNFDDYDAAFKTYIAPAATPSPTPTPAGDTTPPGTTLTPADLLKTKDRTPTYQFAGTEVSVRFECSVDGEAFAACASPLTLEKLSKGAHTFAVRAIDQAGNADQTPATDAFKVTKRRKR
jgi:hypothetical protein